MDAPKLDTIGNNETTWVNCPEAEVAQKLFTWASAIEQDTYQQRWANLLFARISSGRNLENLYGLSMSKGAGGAGLNMDIAGYEAPSINLAAEAIETLVSRVASGSKPWVTFTTNGGNYGERRRAKLATQYIDGLFWSNKLFNIMPEVAADSYRWGIGAFKVFPGPKKSIKAERVLIDELRIDAGDARMGQLSMIGHVRFVPKAKLAGMYPDKAAEIWQSGGVYPGLMLGATMALNLDQYAVVTEGWALSDDAADTKGRHVLIVGESTVLTCDDWEYPLLPFAFLNAYKTGVGFMPQGIVEQIAPYLAHINRITKVMVEAQRRVGAPKWMVPHDSRECVPSLTNRVAVAVVHKGGAPMCVTPPPISAQMISDRQFWIDAARLRWGGNLAQSAGTNPLGAGASGAAIEMLDDTGSARHRYLGERIEECVVQLAEVMLMFCQKIKPEIKAPGRRGTRLLKWDDVKLTDGFITQCWPVSSLGFSPAGKAKRAKELLDIGQITRADYARVIGQQDIDAITSPLEAGQDLVEWMIESILDGEYQSPEENCPLELCLSLGNAAWCREKILGAPDSVLDDLQRFLSEADTLLKKKKAADAPPPAQGPELPATAQYGVAQVPGGAAPAGPPAIGPTGT